MRLVDPFLDRMQLCRWTPKALNSGDLDAMEVDQLGCASIDGQVDKLAVDLLLSQGDSAWSTTPGSATNLGPAKSKVFPEKMDKKSAVRRIRDGLFLPCKKTKN